ncbi:MAG: ATP-binding cassette domain-containing protein [Lachnospiraceae bacterium]
MASIEVNNLSFSYPGSSDLVFKQVSFLVDTEWRLGIVGGNGKGKTTFLRLLQGEYEYSGLIRNTIPVKYCPGVIDVKNGQEMAVTVYGERYPGYELWRVIRELHSLEMVEDILYEPWKNLSPGEKTRIMLAFLFSYPDTYLLLDEPTNNLDEQTREVVKKYLQRKKSFILVSHERDVLDACVDHILAINRSSIEVCKGNFSTWYENKKNRDSFEIQTDSKLRKEIGRLEQAARESAEWANQIEQTKIGFNPVCEDRWKDSRCYIGEKTRRMEKRKKNLENRAFREIEEKKALLKDVETEQDLKLFIQKGQKGTYIWADKIGIKYGEKTVCENVSFTVESGERVLLSGKNGCGKTSIIKAIAGARENMSGELVIKGGISISYVSQNLNLQSENLKELAQRKRIEITTLLSVLRQMGFDRIQFDKPLEQLSDGQKRKVSLAASLCESADLYIWDEPMNFIDLFTRIQLENLILKYKPTMLFIEHDEYFSSKIATKEVKI